MSQIRPTGPLWVPSPLTWAFSPPMGPTSTCGSPKGLRVPPSPPCIPKAPPPRVPSPPGLPLDPNQPPSAPQYQGCGRAPPAPGLSPSRWRCGCRGGRGRGRRGRHRRGVPQDWGCKWERGRRPPRPPSSLGTPTLSPGHPRVLAGGFRAQGWGRGPGQTSIPRTPPSQYPPPWDPPAVLLHPSAAVSTSQGQGQAQQLGRDPGVRASQQHPPSPKPPNCP